MSEKLNEEMFSTIAIALSIALFLLYPLMIVRIKILFMKYRLVVVVYFTI